MSTTQTAPVVHYQIDPAHTSAEFKVRHMMISNVKGQFTKVTGSVDFDPTAVSASSIDVTIDAAGINTGEPQRDEHLKSADFFDVAKFPHITFRSKKITPTGADAYDVLGELSIHGVTKEIHLAVDSLTPETKDPWGGTRRGATATARINRKDFGLHWNAALEAGGVIVGDEVQIAVDVELVRKS